MGSIETQIANHQLNWPEEEALERWNELQTAIDRSSQQILSNKIRNWAKSVPVENVIALIHELENNL